MVDCDEGPKSSGIGKKRKTLIFFEKAFLAVKKFPYNIQNGGLYS
jgi:hypothetical protein